MDYFSNLRQLTHESPDAPFLGYWKKRFAKDPLKKIIVPLYSYDDENLIRYLQFDQ